MTAAAEMTIERAMDITRSICARVFLADGITDDPKLPDLAGVSLLEMLTAAKMVAGSNQTAPSENGKRTFYVVPDDRLIAAVYVGINYEARDTPIVLETERLSSSDWNVKAVTVVDVIRKFKLVDGKGASA